MRQILLLAAFAFAASSGAQQPASAPARLMIGPDVYLKAPQPFPVNLSDAKTRLDSIRAGNLAPRVWGMTNAGPCRAIAYADTSGWRRDGDLSLPVSFGRDSSFRSYHGGLRWKADSLELIVENGWWGVAYDSAGYLTSCRVGARSGEYIVSETKTPTGYQFRAFPWTQAWGPSGAIVGNAPTEEGLRVLWTSFLTMLPPRCRYMTGGPVSDPRAPPC